MKIRPEGAEMSHAYRHNEANSRFSNFANVPKKSIKEAVGLTTILDAFSPRVLPPYR
jgi:hypothetical protein